MTTKIQQAKVAIAEGKTRGQFIQEHTGHIPTKPITKCLQACQTWADAYTRAMQEIEVEQAHD